MGNEDSVTKPQGETGKALSHCPLREFIINFHTQQEQKKHTLLSEKSRQELCRAAATPV